MLDFKQFWLRVKRDTTERLLHHLGATGRARPEQTLFLTRINQAGGLGFVARNCRDVFAALGQAP
jgi:hypothetical protein